MRLRRFVMAAVLLAGSTAIAPRAAAAVPTTITNQGRLFDAEGKPVDGQLSVLFAVYDTENATTPIWSEEHALFFDQGYYSVSLGSVVPFGATVFDGSRRYFGITIGDEPELLPRAPIQSVPYALLANDVNGDIHPTSVSIGDQEVINEQGQWVGDPTGLLGPAGPTGATGPIGPAGAAGPSGTTGATGPMGPQGSMGPTGAAGIQGAAGPTGAMGMQGPIGPAGPTGAMGMQGPIGPAGPTGAMGMQGPIGPAGPTGAMGMQGPIGPTGADGAMGTQGPIGPAGPMGMQGPIGPTGAMGPMGIQGPIGPTGADGAIGIQGPIGPTGATGPMGIQGLIGPTGADGAMGIQGPVGPTGATGPMGIQGPIGPTGADGAMGTAGPQGPAGPTGATGPAGPAGSNGGSSVTVRFTRATPPSGSTMATLDTACATEYGANYQLADLRDLGTLWSGGLSLNGLNEAFWANNAGTINGFSLNGLNVNSVSPTSAPAACIRNDAIIRYTRALGSTAASIATLDAICVSAFGASYQVADVHDLAALWGGNVNLGINPRFVATYQGATYGLVSAFAANGSNPASLSQFGGAGTYPVVCIRLTP